MQLQIKMTKLMLNPSTASEVLLLSFWKELIYRVYRNRNTPACEYKQLSNPKRDVGLLQ